MSLIDARIRELNARVSELLGFNNQFEERARVAERAIKALTTPRPLDDYHEDMGAVLWWRWEGPQPFRRISACLVSSAHDGCWAGEAPYVGSPINDDWPGYHTHWTPLPTVGAPPKEKK